MISVEVKKCKVFFGIGELFISPLLRKNKHRLLQKIKTVL